jgi:hypothetical protein
MEPVDTAADGPLRPARTPTGLDTRSSLRGATWRTGCGVKCVRQLRPARAFSECRYCRLGHRQMLVQAQVLSQHRMTSVVQSKPVREPLANWIRAWNSPGLQRAIQPLEPSNVHHSSVQGCAGNPRDDDRSSRSLAPTWLQNLFACVTSRAVADGCFEAEHAAYLLVYERTE